jgi:hypothetical protein
MPRMVTAVPPQPPQVRMRMRLARSTLRAATIYGAGLNIMRVACQKWFKALDIAGLRPVHPSILVLRLARSMAQHVVGGPAAALLDHRRHGAGRVGGLLRALGECWCKDTGRRKHTRTYMLPA